MKYWTTKLLIFLLFILTVVSAYNYFKRPFSSKNTQNNSAATSAITPTSSQKPKKDLSTREKITQLLVVPVDVNELEKNSSESAKMISFIKDNDPGFVLYFGEKISTSAAILATKTIYDNFKETDYVPLIAVDHEGGLVQRLNGEGFTKLDSWQKIVSTYSSAQQKAIFNQSAAELNAVGINIVFAPVVDLASSSAVLKTRAASDMDQVFTAASNYINSFSQNGIMPVIKHFPGIGSISKDPHNVISTISLGKEDTEIFSNLLNKFTNIGVMTTHVRLENKLSGKVCSLSEECLSKFTQYYPKVILFTDDLSMKAARYQDGTSEEKEIAQIAIEAIEAGNNALTLGKNTSIETLEKTIYALQSEYNDSESFRKKVDDSVAKILELKK